MSQLKSENSLKKGPGLSSETDHRIRKLLLPGHLCRVALEVKKSNSGGGGRLLCIVSPAEGKSQRESCLFILRTKLFSTSYQVKKMIPILSDFQASITGDNQFEISWLSKKRETREYVADSAESLGVLLRTASKAHQIACNQRLDIASVAAGNSHVWLVGYSEDEQAMKQMAWLKSQPVNIQEQMAPPSYALPAHDPEFKVAQTLIRAYSCSVENSASPLTSLNTRLPKPGHTFVADEAANDPLVISFMTTEARQRWIDDRLRLLQDRFVDLVPISVRICTWNVAAQFPVEAEDVVSVREWLIPSGRGKPDIISVGLLETVKLTANALMVNEASFESKRWADLISALLDVPSQYTLLLSRQYVGIYHILLAKTSLVAAGIVRGARSKCAGCGILGFGNKGAVSISVFVHSDTICFVCSHLAAGQKEVQRRNNDEGEIRRNTVFRPFPQQISGVSIEKLEVLVGDKVPAQGGLHSADLEKRSRVIEAVKLYATASDNAPACIEDHDFQFWFGDLNYRIDRSRTDIIDALQTGNLEELQQDDQLRKQMQAGRCFSGYQEAATDFFPTYKYDLGTDVFDTTDKSRAPAWCDRILSRTRHGKVNLSQTRYERHAIHLSDHKPVSATYSLKIKRTDKEKLARVAAEVSRQLDVADNECIPSAVVDINEVFFADVEYRQPQSRVLTITNDGNVMAHYRFIPKGGHDAPHTVSKNWLTVRPKYGLLMPGESAELRLTILVKDDAARALARGDREELEDVLILHVEGGNDTFVSVTGEFLASCFGSSIQSLLELKTPARFAQDCTSRLPTLHLPPIPREVWRLCGAILEKGMDEDKIFFLCGDETEVGEIRTCLDTGASFRSDIQPHSFAEALVQFLRSLPVPVIPPKFSHECIQSCRSREQCWTALEAMPGEHLTLLQYLVAFLKQLLAHSQENRLTIESLSLLMAAVLMGSDWNSTEGPGPQNEDLASEREVMVRLLEHQ